jgi:hypothetical protein
MFSNVDAWYSDVEIFPVIATFFVRSYRNVHRVGHVTYIIRNHHIFINNTQRNREEI